MTGVQTCALPIFPLQDVSWQGGGIAVKLKVDPQKQNYFTARFWGGEANENRLILFCEGKQIGYRHLGDIDILEFGQDDEAPPFTGRWFYTTSPLPIAMTQGKTELSFEIRSTGHTWAYGTTFQSYQKPMTHPTRGIYAAYTHTDGCFVPPADEKQGDVPTNVPVRSSPGPEVLDRLKDRVNAEINREISGENPLIQMQMQFLARAYHVKWSAAYHNPKVIEREIQCLDNIFAMYRANPRLARSDPATWNADWFGLGPSGDVVRYLADQLRPVLDQEIDDPKGGKITRRAAYSEMLVASRDWHRQHRRMYTNQSMINDLYMYAAHRGIAAIDPAHAVPEAEMLRYLYESVGLQPWLGSDDQNGKPTKPVGESYYELTDKGLTRELGFVGYYGEVLDWVTSIYDSTRPSLDQPGDPRIKAQLAKIAIARAPFRYPMLDADGNRAMRAETIVGWRDAHYPGEVTYAQRSSWDGTPLQTAAATRDPKLIGFARQMLEDNQLFKSIEIRMRDNGFRVTAGLLQEPDDYEIVKSMTDLASGKESPADSGGTAPRLPMSPGQPDFVFSDEQDGVVAIKNGDEILYASLYWRARNAINFLARIHLISPKFDRIAVVHEETQFKPSKMTFTRPDYVNFGFANGGPRYPVELHSAHAGEKLPIPVLPEGVRFRPGDENVFAGKGDLYTCRYGNYLIAMNCTSAKSFDLTIPAEFAMAKELVSKKTISDAPSLKVGPQSTVVLFKKAP